MNIQDWILLILGRLLIGIIIGAWSALKDKNV